MAELLIERGKEYDNGYTSVTLKCSDCDWTAWSSMRTDRLGDPAYGRQDAHTRQHEPGRALDIEVDWTPSGLCPVCPDGIGDIGWGDDDDVRCKDCGTTWNRDGTNGQRAETED